MESNYHKLNKYEKLNEIQELNFARCERHNVAVYLKALWLNDIDLINEYERFGKTARQILMNKRQYDKNVEFGFTEISFDENGWLKRNEFEEIDKIEFQHPKEQWSNNYVDVAKAPNGVWFYQITFKLGNGGGGCNVSVWSDYRENKKEALISGIYLIISRHEKDKSKSDYNPAYSNHITKLCEEKKNELLGINEFSQKQLSLF